MRLSRGLDTVPDVSGERGGAGTTVSMIFDVATPVAYVSGGTSVRPGDVIATGTPAADLAVCDQVRLGAVGFGRTTPARRGSRMKGFRHGF